MMVWYYLVLKFNCIFKCEAHGGAVGRATVQAGRTWAQFPLSLEFVIDKILSAALWPWDNSASDRNEYEEYFLGCKGGWYNGLMILPPSCAYCLEIWSLNLVEPSRPVHGLLYLYLILNYKLLK
jgi:hypothetical protein